MTAWRRWDDYDRSRPFAAWLRGIATRNIMSWRRRSVRRHVNCDEATLEYLGGVLSQVQQLAGDTFSKKLDALRVCIESLPQSYRETIRLRYEENLMPAALADLQAVKLETVKKQLQRAKLMLFECVTRKLPDVIPQS